ncbi:tail fiber protein [Fulvivirgaceae bacterium BMA12]|uniref:Tail fiber protein n=1 Tax=Agaribacillus aureus TaxID=3051825 RepID=A0ABT8LG00_9BACT|nr:tail fiber protein [Fulvivirgaceae bacterium BMA12]
MKIKIFCATTFFCLAIVYNGSSQWVPSNPNEYILGNIGVGTNTNLDSRISAVGNIWQLKLLNDATGGSEWRIGSSSNTWGSSGGKLIITNTGSSTSAAMVIDNQKRVGIGINDPSSLLSVSGDIALKYGSELKTTTGTYQTIFKTGWDGAQDFLTFYVAGNKPDDALPKIHIRSDGNVGIGTTVPDSRLTVNGKVHAKEVKIDLNIAAADYVFENDYPLRSLEDTEKYIKEKKHLPGIPSGKEMETNGIHLSEMNMKLLEKVEELTLHLISLNNQVKQLKIDNEKLKKAVQAGE